MDRKLAFNCKTLEDAQDFIYQCVKHDINVWRSATWDVYKENTCFVIDDNNRLMYCDGTGYTISKMKKYEVVAYEKGDSIFGVKYEKLKGEGQCTCNICNSTNWTSMCYRVFDKNSEYNHKVICSQCKIKMENGRL